MHYEGLRRAHQAVQDVLAQDVTGSKFEDHVFVGGEHQRTQKLQASFGKVNEQHWILRVQLC